MLRQQWLKTDIPYASIKGEMFIKWSGNKRTGKQLTDTILYEFLYVLCDRLQLTSEEVWIETVQTWIYRALQTYQY